MKSGKTRQNWYHRKSHKRSSWGPLTCNVKLWSHHQCVQTFGTLLNLTYILTATYTDVTCVPSNLTIWRSHLTSTPVHIQYYWSQWYNLWYWFCHLTRDASEKNRLPSNEKYHAQNINGSFSSSQKILMTFPHFFDKIVQCRWIVTIPSTRYNKSVDWLIFFLPRDTRHRESAPPS